MNTNPDSLYMPPIIIDEIAPTNTDLLLIVREDIAQGVRPLLTNNDEEARVLISVVGQGVFLAAFATNKQGEHRNLDIPVETVFEMWQLKRGQYEPEKGSWFSAEFTVEPDGFIKKTKYNYDKEVFSSLVGPHMWYTRPEVETEEEKSVWTHDQYKEDLEAFPRPSTPQWLIEA